MFGFIKDTVALSYAAYFNTFKRADNPEVTLVYHSIGNLAVKYDPYKLNIKPQFFNEHLSFLNSFIEKKVLITFDDGFKNFFEIVFPWLLKYNIRVILFVTTGFIDGTISFAEYFDGNFSPNPLSWKEIKEISQSGIEIGSHGLTHRNLLKLDETEVLTELRDSKNKIEDIIGKKVRYFAYPFGSRQSFNSRVKNAVKACGYENAYSNIMGFNSIDTDLFELKRIRVYSDDNLFRFRIKINGGYNWLDNFTI